MQQPSNSKQAGFTLIEVMMVVAIVAILAAIALPVYRGYQDRARAADVLLHYDGLKPKVLVSGNVEDRSCTDLASSMVASDLNDPYVSMALVFAPVAGQANRFQPLLNICAAADTAMSQGVAKAAHDEFQKTGLLAPNPLNQATVNSFSVYFDQAKGLTCAGPAPLTYPHCSVGGVATAPSIVPVLTGPSTPPAVQPTQAPATNPPVVASASATQAQPATASGSSTGTGIGTGSTGTSTSTSSGSGSSTGSGSSAAVLPALPLVDWCTNTRNSCNALYRNQHPYGQWKHCMGRCS